MMTPKQETPKKVTKRAPAKSPAKMTLSKDSDLKKQLLFLWACHKSSDGHVSTIQLALPSTNWSNNLNLGQHRCCR